MFIVRRPSRLVLLAFAFNMTWSTVAIIYGGAEIHIDIIQLSLLARVEILQVPRQGSSKINIKHATRMTVTSST